MSAVIPCPRCSQMVPVTARFCRRCGTNLAPPAPAAKAVVAKRGLAVSLVLSALLVAAIVIGGFVVYSVRETTSVDSPAPVYVAPPVQGMYPPPGKPAYKGYPPMMIPPAYPRQERGDRERHRYESRR